jgi:hypothetical protein
MITTRSLGLLVGALALVASCEGLTAPPQPRVSVLKRTPEGCFALMTPDTPVADVLGVADTCSYASDPMLFAGLDLVELVIDYGPDVEFAGNTSAPPPIVTLTVDAVPSDEPIEISAERRVGGRAFFVATFHAPLVPSRDVKLTVGVNPGFQTTVPIVFETSPPTVELQILDCLQGVQCQLQGAVGSAHALIALPGDVPQTVAIHTSIDGIAQGDPIAPVTTLPVSGHTEHLTALPVPATHDGGIWVVSAQLGAATPSSVTVIIHDPTIASALSCAPTCNLRRGDAVGLTITAPALIRPLEARVFTRIGGVPQLVDAPVALVQHADGTATGALALQAPPTIGTWQIDVSVAGYPAPAIVTSVQ